MWSISEIPTVGSLLASNSPAGPFNFTSCFFDVAFRLPVTRRNAMFLSYVLTMNKYAVTGIRPTQG